MDRVTASRRIAAARRRLFTAAAVLGGLFALGLAVDSAALGLALRDVDRGGRLLAQAADAVGRHPDAWTADRIAAAARLNAEAAPLLRSGCERLRQDPVLWSASRTPLAGDQAVATLDLCVAALATTSSVVDLLSIASAYLAEEHDPAPSGERFLRLMKATTPPLTDAARRLGPALMTLAADRSRPLLPPLRAKLDEVAAKLAAVQGPVATAAAVGPFLPAVLGASRPATYLLLLQNPSELRPSGGLIGAVGTITFSGGAPSQLEIRPYDDYNPLFSRPFPVPAPLDRYMIFYRNSLELGDAGWDADFPSTARLVEEMYGSATGRSVDGTVALDPYAIAALLRVIGPVEVPGYGTFTADDFFVKVNTIVNARSVPHEGKQALPVIAHEILKNVLGQPLTSWPGLLDAFSEQAGQRHLQLSLHDSRLAGLLRRAGLDGSLVDAGGDYLMAVDANVGATKGDAYAVKQMRVMTEVYPSGVSRHQVTLSYRLPVFTDPVALLLNPGDGSYRDYVRIYIPEHAALASMRVSIDGDTVATRPTTLAVEHGRTVVGAFFMLPPGHAAQVEFNYEVALPPGNSYRLFVQKQAGVPGLPTTVAISYPGGRDERRMSLQRDEQVTYRW